MRVIREAYGRRGCPPTSQPALFKPPTMSSAPRAGVGLTETTKLAIRAVPLRAMGRPHSLFGRTGNSKIPARWLPREQERCCEGHTFAASVTGLPPPVDPTPPGSFSARRASGEWRPQSGECQISHLEEQRPCMKSAAPPVTHHWLSHEDPSPRIGARLPSFPEMQPPKSRRPQKRHARREAASNSEMSYRGAI
jgi:hypothetical protein